MNVTKLAWQLKTFWHFFIAPPKNWSLPKKSEVLIYDTSGVELLMPYLTKYRVEVIPLRGESVNIPCLLRAMLKPRFWVKKPLHTYAEAFIKAVSPKIVITFIDNNINFYTISKVFPEVKTIFIQNGLRGGERDIFASLSQSGQYQVDYMLVFNNAFGNAFQKFIEGQSLPIGSLKNNIAVKNYEIANGVVLFISQYRCVPRNSAVLTVDEDGIAISWEKFYESEILVLSFLKKWCVKNHKLLRVAGCMTEFQDAERDFFAANLEDCNWEYAAKSELFRSYTLVDDAEIVVFIDSALGFESIGRGKKTAGLSCRGGLLNDRSLNFGWPGALPDEGPFWTSSADDRQFQRVMDYLAVVSDEEWERVRLTYAQDLMAFDPGNTQFQALLARLLLQSRVSASH